MKSTCDLPHHDARRIAIVGQVVAVGRQHADAAGDQRQNSKLLRDQLTRQARGILDDDDPNAVAYDAVEQVCKAFTALDRISAGHRNVGELVHQLECDCRGL